MKTTDWSRMKLPEAIKPGHDTMETISTFWLIVPSLPQMSYSELSDEFLNYLYNEGYKIVRLDDKDLQ